MFHKTDKSVQQAEEWISFHKEKVKTNYPKWPNEAMLKVLFGRYLKQPAQIQPEFKVLDIGCGFGNNLLPFLDIGCECHGLEIDQKIADLATSIQSAKGFKTVIRQGSNREIPYDDNFFDLILSINTIHYENSEKKVLAAFKEFRRVLKPKKGILYLTTVGHGHEIFKCSVPLKGHCYRIKDFDFRNGQKFFFFDSKNHLKSCLSSVFEDIEAGQVTEKLMRLSLDFLIAVCR